MGNKAKDDRQLYMCPKIVKMWISVIVVHVTAVRERVCLESQPKTMELGAFGLGLDSYSIYSGLCLVLTKTLMWMLFAGSFQTKLSN